MKTNLYCIKGVDCKIEINNYKELGLETPDFVEWMSEGFDIIADSNSRSVNVLFILLHNLKPYSNYGEINYDELESISKRKRKTIVNFLEYLVNNKILLGVNSKYYYFNPYYFFRGLHIEKVITKSIKEYCKCLNITPKIINNEKELIDYFKELFK